MQKMNYRRRTIYYLFKLFYATQQTDGLQYLQVTLVITKFYFLSGSFFMVKLVSTFWVTNSFVNQFVVER